VFYLKAVIIILLLGKNVNKNHVTDSNCNGQIVNRQCTVHTTDNSARKIIWYTCSFCNDRLVK